MEMLSVSQYAEQNGISERTVRNWCATGKMEGAILVGKTWNIPADAPLPRKGKSKESHLPYGASACPYESAALFL